jgi:preprotein translocase subunit SecA
MSIFTKIFGDPNAKTIAEVNTIVEKINVLEKSFALLSAEELRAKTEEFKKRISGVDFDLDNISNPEEKKEMKEKLQLRLNEVLPEAFAAVREASKRVIGQKHYDVQLIGGIILHRGQIAEMKTGEGKTLVATLPLYLNALAGKGAHLVTVNDYLSRVGAGWMSPVFHFLGMTTSVIIHDQALQYDPDYTDDSQYDDRLKHFRPISRREAYACDIMYGTNNELGFDYLRDNMAPSPDAMVQRELHYAIVDEIDSILIDEARTPLIISAPAEESTDKYYKFAELIARLTENEDYNVDEKMKAATLTEAGIAKMEKWLGVENIYTTGGIGEVHHIEQALKAHTLFKIDRDYVVKDGEVIIVDEFTGRLMPGRRYSEGLHQAIEAKERVKIQRESQTLATITFQNFFRMYSKLSGMTGTAVTEAEEFSKIYNLETIMIPTNMPNIREDLNDLIYKTEIGKFNAVVQEVKHRHELGQPILVGTISIEKNEILTQMMEREGLHPRALNAKNHEKEAMIIAEAGCLGAITMATNMAGRGVDIMLGGKEPVHTAFAVNATAEESAEHRQWREEHDKILALGGLHVIGTERHESRRIDNQLRGRAGRQGDPGSSQFFVSMEDDLMRIFGGDRMKSIMTTLKVPEDMPIENRLITKSIESSQKRVEGNNFDIRKHLVEYDDVINKHREMIYRRRKEILRANSRVLTENFPEKDKVILSRIILKMVENEIESVISFHTAAEEMQNWNLDEIYQVITTIFTVDDKFKADFSKFTGETPKLDKALARTEIIEHLKKISENKYAEIIEKADKLGINWPDVEKSVLIRSIDSLWVEHLDAMSSLRQGIGLRGYGQRDPLVEYKKEAYLLFNELNSLINKEVVYSIYKIGDINNISVEQLAGPGLLHRATQFSAPAKTAVSKSSDLAQNLKSDYTRDGDMVKAKVKNDFGEKIGRNDLCPCGSGKKYKKCCGK